MRERLGLHSALDWLREVIHDILGTRVCRWREDDTPGWPRAEIVGPGRIYFTVKIPYGNIPRLSDKSQFAVWADHIKKRLEGVGIVENDCGNLRFIEEQSGAIPVDRMRDTWPRESAANLLIRDTVDPWLFECGALRSTKVGDGSLSVCWLYDEVRFWAARPGRDPCRICWNLSKLVYSPRNALVFQSKPAEEFQAEASKGCKSCEAVIAAIETTRPGSSSQLDGKRIAITKVPDRAAPPQKQVLGLLVTDGATTQWSASSFELEVHNQVESDSTQSSTDSVPSSPLFGLPWVGKMIQDCHCHYAQPSYVPPTLLRVPPKSGGIEIVENLGPKVKYCALSYYGSISQPGTQSCMPRMQNSNTIWRTDLPKAILDAILICQYLGIDYMWVESICSDQPLPGTTGWKQHQDTVSRVYSSAFIVLAMHGSTESSTDTLGPDKLPARFEVVGHDGISSHYVAKDKTPSLHDRPYFLHTETPLSKKSSAFKHLLLARIVLHYTGDDLVWECKEHFECFHGYSCERIIDRLDSKNPRKEWQALITCYSHRRPDDIILKLADMMPAPTMVMQELKPSDYLAGLWKPNLREELLWYVTGSGPHRRFPSYVAPSWSWASVDGGVSYLNYKYWANSYEFHPSVDIIEAQCSRMHPDEQFGQVSDGYIQASGRIVPVELAVLDGVFRKGRGEYTGLLGRPHRIHDGQTTLVRAGCNQAYEVLCDERMDVDMCDPEGRDCWLDAKCHYPKVACTCDADAGERGFYCLEIGSLMRKSASDHEYRDDDPWNPKFSTVVWWLVLRLSARVDGAFERVGVGYRVNSWNDQCLLFKGCKKSVVRLV